MLVATAGETAETAANGTGTAIAAPQEDAKTTGVASATVNLPVVLVVPAPAATTIGAAWGEEWAATANTVPSIAIGAIG